MEAEESSETFVNFYQKYIDVLEEPASSIFDVEV
jgi:hypothetical protein